MAVFQFIFLLYAIITLESLRPSAIPAHPYSSHEPYALTTTLNQDAHHSSATVDSTARNAADIIADRLDDIAVAIAPPQLSFVIARETRATHVGRGPLYYAFSGLSPPRFS